MECISLCKTGKRARILFHFGTSADLFIPTIGTWNLGTSGWNTVEEHSSSLFIRACLRNSFLAASFDTLEDKSWPSKLKRMTGKSFRFLLQEMTQTCLIFKAASPFFSSLSFLFSSAQRFANFEWLVSYLLWSRLQNEKILSFPVLIREERKLCEFLHFQISTQALMFKLAGWP